MKKLSDYLDQKDAKFFQYFGLIIIFIAVGYIIFSGGDKFAIRKPVNDKFFDCKW